MKAQTPRSLSAQEWARHPLNKFRGWLLVIIMFYLIVGVLGSVTMAAGAMMNNAPEIGPPSAPGWVLYLAAAIVLAHSVFSLTLMGARSFLTPKAVLASGLGAIAALTALEASYGAVNWLDSLFGAAVICAIAAYLRFSARGRVMFTRLTQDHADLSAQAGYQSGD